MKYQESYFSFSKRFCSNFTRELKRAGMSQREQILAGLDNRYINRIKKGERAPNLRTLWKICSIAGIDPVSLFK